jgi:zinc protease
MMKTFHAMKYFLFLISIFFAEFSNPSDVVAQAHADKPIHPVAIPDAISGNSIPMDPAVRMGTLPNGITYYIRYNAKPEKRAELRMAVKAGSMQEDADQLGLAHFTEHMAFNGSRNFSKNELVNYLETVGSRFGPDLNAYTSFDETVYMLQVRTDDPEHFDKGMLILRDWADGISFDPEEIDKERGVVISEWRSRLSSGQRMLQQYLPVIYYKSRYADRLPIGDPQIVENSPYEASKRFYVDWYRPDLMAVFVVGDMDLDSAEQKIKEQFGSMLPAYKPREKETVEFPTHEQTLVKIVTDLEATNSNIRVIYKHIYTPVVTEVDYRERLIHSLYNRMLGKRLAEFTRQANPPYLFGNTSYGQDVAELATYTSTASGDAKDIRRAYRTLLEENQRVLLHGFTQSELDREKAALLRQAEQSVLEQDKQESSRVVQRLVNHFLDNNPVPDAKQHFDLYNKMMPTIHVAEVSQLAKKWITNRNNVVILTAPEKDRALLPDSAELIKIMNEVTQAKLLPYVDIDVSAPIVSGEFPDRPVLDVQHDEKLGVYHWRFENGVRVTAKPTTFKNDEILMSAYSPGGHSLYGDDMYPSARSVSSVIQSSGVGPYTATGLDKKLSGLRVGVSPFVLERFEGLSGSSSVADVETMMQLTYAWVTAYREDTTALNAYVSRERTMFGNLLSNPNNWFSDKLSKITTQNHPRRGFPEMESYDDITMTEIMHIYKDRFSDVSDMHFFFVGNFDPAQLQKLTARYLGALPGGGRKEEGKDIGVRMPEGVIDSVYHRGEAPKSLVQLIYHGDAVFHIDSGYVLQSLLDLARIKLRESLREEEGGVYGVSISGGQTKFPEGEYSVQISFNAEPSRTLQLTQKAKEVIMQLQNHVDPADIIKVTEAQRQGRIKDLQQNQFWMNAFVNGWINDLQLIDQVPLEKLEKQIAGLNPEVLMQAARRYFNEAQRISVLMYPEKT